VSNRIVFLLRQATTSTYFSYFPAVAAAPPTPLERRFTQEYASAWREVGDSCPDPSYDPTCPTYSSIKVVPDHLHLEDSTPTPLYVYGLLNNQWLLAYSPTSSASSSRNCAVTLTSSDVAVVDFVTNDVTKSETAVATGVGNATIEVSVQGVAGTLSVPVSVTGVGN
jgi:hypothetical protein